MAFATSLLFDAAIVGPALAITMLKSKNIVPTGGRLSSAVAIGGGVALGALCLSKFLQKTDFKRSFSILSNSKDADTTAPSPLPSFELPSADQTFNLIKKRRSIYPRDFNGERVPREHINKMLEAANWAPSNGLTEPYRFVVIEGEERFKLQELMVELISTKSPPEEAEIRVKRFARKRVFWPNVSAFIALCCKLEHVPGRKKQNPEWEEICAVGAAAQNMLLQATALGVAAYWASFPDVVREADEFKKYLNITPEDRCLGFVVLGQSDRIEGYRGKRGDWQAKVEYRE